MSCRSLVAILLLGCGLSLIPSPSPAAGKKKVADKSDPALATVGKILRAEVAGQLDRRGQLAGALTQHPDSNSARWQAGFVRDGDSWRSFDEPESLADSECFRKYINRREQAPQTAIGQLDLANWCSKQGLTSRERAHLWAALSLGVGDATEAVAARLGHAQIDGRWLSREQLLEWRVLNRQAVQSCKKWEPQLTKLIDRLAGSPAQRERAIADLKKIIDDSAIPAIEYLLAGKDEGTALVAVDLLQPFQAFEASVTLARQAVFSPWPDVRKSAGAALNGRPLDHFVPELLGLLSSSITTALRTWQDTRVEFDQPLGTLYYNYVLARETENQFQLATLLTVDHSIESRVAIGVGVIFGNISVLVDPEILSPRFDNDRRRSLADRLQPREDAVLRENERIAEFNRRVGLVLAGVSGQDPQPTPQDWWQWWSRYSDVESSSPKAVVTVSEQESIGVPSLPRVVYRSSCFAAGTPVWTESGAQPIETIKVGDRVLAKDVESGELVYKPVLQTTVRPPKELTTLRFGDETVVCTGGHRFWSSGSGWIKARDLAPQTLLHTVTGNTPVWSAKKGTTAETYNVVVADFHTYFVGKTGVLCQDLLIPKSTNNVVPGLPRANAIVQK